MLSHTFSETNNIFIICSDQNLFIVLLCLIQMQFNFPIKINDIYNKARILLLVDLRDFFFQI